MNRDIGAALRALRSASGLTAATLARRAAMSAGKLSKIENGRVRPTAADVELLLTALGVSDEARGEFVAAVRAAATEATAWRLLRRMGPSKHQQAIRALEAQTTTLRLFQGQLIPGLLQTPEYASAVLSLPPGLPEQTKAATLAARLARQTILYEEGRTFHFLVCEHVLRWLICTPTVMAVQLDRLVSLSRLPAVRIGVLPLAARMPDFPMTCFSLHDTRLVLVETFHAEITTTDPSDVQTYAATFERFAAAAVFGDDMRAVVETVRDEFLRDRERTCPGSDGRS
ncbi:helix-turn-helix domain-containing protein [Yinghuangia soli]|uniref:Helix-turn-helix domain-containing protein n=1 Tax=Yinghuangia soli TaxID=2908204 RepID=A0AA41Q1J6_9ACTN|nr:helix-turn-helix transcriptional regulator [Yinghuangia soli]MCF2529818.1 helix-turn-helix domain-containing protein [Yinghuangia soli]